MTEIFAADFSGVTVSEADAAVEIGRCRTALCTAAELSLLLGDSALPEEAQATLDALRSQLRGLGFSA